MEIIFCIELISKETVSSINCNICHEKGNGTDWHLKCYTDTWIPGKGKVLVRHGHQGPEKLR